jgi:hypothetical protein
MNLKFLSAFLTIFWLASSVFAQNPTENLLEKTELIFSLGGEPTPQDVGFDNPKSYWKVKYKLFLTDFSELEKLGICRRDEAGRHICPIVREKKISRRIRKKSSKIFAGNFTRKSLADESNREVVIPINLSPDVVAIFNQATKLPEKNPTFVLFVTERIFVKNSDAAKLKTKYSTTGIKNLKNAMSNQTFDYWDVSRLSMSSSIEREENGKLKFFGGLIHYGGLNE